MGILGFHRFSGLVKMLISIQWPGDLGFPIGTKQLTGSQEMFGGSRIKAQDCRKRMNANLTFLGLVEKGLIAGSSKLPLQLLLAKLIIASRAYLQTPIKKSTSFMVLTCWLHL